MKGGRIPYNAREMAWLEANRDMVISDFHRAFQAAFSRPDVTAGNLHSLRKRKGWKVGRAPDRYVGRQWKYSPEEMAWLSAHRTLEIGDLHRDFCATFLRDDITACALNGLRKKHGWKTGRDGRFNKGRAPANKGKRCPEGVGGRSPASRRTQFRAGHLGGRAAENRLPVGAEVLREDGYLYRKINDGRPFYKRWRAAHLVEWEALHGPLPDGHCLKCLGDDRANTDPANWEMIPRGVLPRLNGGRSTMVMAYDEASPEVRPVLLALARLDHKARELRRKAGAR